MFRVHGIVFRRRLVYKFQAGCVLNVFPIWCDQELSLTGCHSWVLNRDRNAYLSMQCTSTSFEVFLIGTKMKNGGIFTRPITENLWKYWNWLVVSCFPVCINLFSNSLIEMDGITVIKNDLHAERGTNQVQKQRRKWWLNGRMGPSNNLFMYLVMAIKKMKPNVLETSNSHMY